MFKFITMLFFICVAFCAGKMLASEAPQEEAPVIAAYEQAPNFDQMTNAELMALIRATQAQENSLEKFAKLKALTRLLRARIGS